jgi:membrane protein required for colicin V production
MGVRIFVRPLYYCNDKRYQHINFYNFYIFISMLIDIICVILLVMAIFKGFSQGLIVALFSLVALLIGLAAATKLSAVVASHLQKNMHVTGPWLPILSFIIVFTLVVLIVGWAAAIIKKATHITLLGWVDTLGGIILYALIYLMIFSVVLFYASQMHLISSATIAASRSYNYIQPWGPTVIDQLGKVIPFFQDVFADLQKFFVGVADKAKA